MKSFSNKESLTSKVPFPNSDQARCLVVRLAGSNDALSCTPVFFLSPKRESSHRWFTTWRDLVPTSLRPRSDPRLGERSGEVGAGRQRATTPPASSRIDPWVKLFRLCLNFAVESNQRAESVEKFGNGKQRKRETSKRLMFDWILWMEYEPCCK